MNYFYECHSLEEAQYLYNLLLDMFNSDYRAKDGKEEIKKVKSYFSDYLNSLKESKKNENQ